MAASTSTGPMTSWPAACSPTMGRSRTALRGRRWSRAGVSRCRHPTTCSQGLLDREEALMTLQLTITGFVAIYIFMLAAFTGYEVISRVPAILHTPLMSGSNFVHGIVVVGALYALLNATSLTEQIIGFVGVVLGAANAAGGYVVTIRMLEMFKVSHSRTGEKVT